AVGLAPAAQVPRLLRQAPQLVLVGVLHAGSLVLVLDRGIELLRRGHVSRSPVSGEASPPPLTLLYTIRSPVSTMRFGGPRIAGERRCPPALTLPLLRGLLRHHEPR